MLTPCKLLYNVLILHNALHNVNGMRNMMDGATFEINQNNVVLYSGDDGWFWTMNGILLDNYLSFDTAIAALQNAINYIQAKIKSSIQDKNNAMWECYQVHPFYQNPDKWKDGR